MIQYNHHTLWQRKKREKERKQLIAKIQQAAENNIICSSTWYFFRKNSPQKKKGRGELEKLLPLYVPGIGITSLYRYHIKDALDNHKQTGGGAVCKRPREQRGTDPAFTCVLLRSCRDVRPPRHLPSAKTATFSQPDPDGTTKKQI